MSNKKSLLPVCLQDRNNLALEECMKLAFRIDPKKLVLYPIQNIDEDLLPQLAKENHVLGWEGWNLVESKEEKQRLIENSLEKHAKKGTNPSVIEALKRINIDAKISEFWEYGGRPAHFIMEFLNIYDRGLDGDFEAAIKELINAYKPATRVLDFINYFLCSVGTLYVDGRIKTTETVVIKTNEVIL